jgi:hypothetical protein
LRAHLPLAHARALLAVSQGQVEYLRTWLAIGSHHAGSSCRQTRSLGFGRDDQRPRRRTGFACAAQVRARGQC